MQGFEWQDRLFILVCYESGICSLYSAASDFYISYHQPLSDNGYPIIDAQFFVQQGKLFLAILVQGFDCIMSRLRLVKNFSYL